jgi:predicted RNA-binding Zn ribbon-like protein
MVSPNISEVRHVSANLQLVEDFINSRSVELDTDDIATREDLAAWLRERRLVPSGTTVTPAGHRRAVRLREGLRTLAAAHNEARRDRAAAADVADLARDLPFIADLSGPSPRLVPRSSSAVDAALASILAAVVEAEAEGTWSRFKACRADDCQWAYFDESRNRSRAWCSMASCGNRAKARAFRNRAS